MAPADKILCGCHLPGFRSPRAGVLEEHRKAQCKAGCGPRPMLSTALSPHRHPATGHIGPAFALAPTFHISPFLISPVFYSVGQAIALSPEQG